MPLDHATPQETETLSPELFEKVTKLYDQGLYLQAYEASKQVGPLEKWTGARSRVLGARISNHVGSIRLGRTLLRLAHRRFPDDPEVQYFFTYAMLGRFGAYKSFQRMKELGDLDTGDEMLQSDWFALRGMLYAVFRDFENADKWVDRAIEMQPDRAWLHVQRSTILDLQDRREQAVASAEKAMELQPWFRPAVQNLANRLVQDQRDDEAIELLRAANQKIESGDVRIQLGSLFLELERFDEARELFSNVESYFPLMKMAPKVLESLSAMNADMEYYVGNHKAAAEHAKKANTPFFDSMVERLTDPDFKGKRVRLPVEFVRQDHLTCAPATLTSIANYWKKPVEHLEIVEEICYDGTPAHSERKWAEEQGYQTREFRVTWESAKALIDQGIPFTLTTCEPGSAHLQAVIGYDDYRRSLLIRDPGDRHSREFNADKMLERYESSGPCGMALVPNEKAELLEGIKLPEAKFYDLYYKLQLGLEKHKRDFAAKVVEKLESVSPKHRLTLNANSVVARYDSDLPQLLSTVEALIEKYPKDVNLKVARLACLGELGKAEDRIAVLREFNADPECHPVFWTQLAGELVGDAREKDTVDYLLRRSLKYQSENPTAYSMLGGIHFEEQRKDAAVEALRFAACLDDKNENRAKEYFYACRVTNDTPTAMRYLKDRVQRVGNRSSLPARTLCWAYDQLELTKDSMKTLQEAYQTHKNDGDFLLYTAEYFARWGKFEKAEKLLAKAKPISHAQHWTRIAALIASYQGNNSVALKQWMSLVEKDPLDYVAHRFATGLLADDGGSTAATAHLRKYVDKFPYSYPLRTMLMDWVKEGTKEEIDAELDEFLKHHPDDAWALREKAILYLKHRDFELAEKYISKAHEVEPSVAGTSILRARLHQSRNETAKAIQHYREVLKHSIDSEYAMAGLVHCCYSKTERETQLQFILAELNRQVGLGEGLLTYHALAQTCLDSNQLLNTLKKTLKQNLDCWQAWVAVCRQMSDMQQHENAIKLATKGTQKFPLLPRMWMELASANASAGRIDDEIAAMRKAKEINPTWGDLTRSLAEALEKKGDLAGARKELEANLRIEPRDVVNMGSLASVMWQQEEKEEALQLVAKAVRMQPGYEFGWMALRSWCAELGKPDFDVEVATELTNSRPNEPQSWRMLALTLDQPHQVEDAIAALDKGLSLNPHDVDLHSYKSIMFSQMGMYEEALAAAQPAALANDMPMELVARAAWVEGERGNFDAAISSMEKVVAVDPDYYWAWQELAQWYRYQGNVDRYIASANEMVRIQPQNAVSWGYLGDGELAKDNFDKAKEHFTQAVHLAPTYDYASGRLLDLLVDEKNWDEAKEMLDFVTPHLSPEWVLSEKIRIAALSGDKQVAFEKLQELCQIPGDDPSAIDGAVESLYLAGWTDETLEFLTREIAKPDAKPGVGFVFVHLTTSMGKWDLCETKIKTLKNRKQLWESAAQKFMVESSTAEEFAQHPRMRKFMAENEQALRGSTKMWEWVGSALCMGDMDAEVCTYMADWRNRKDTTPWGLSALAMSLWDQKKDHQANEVSIHSIKNLKPDASTGRHLVLAALYQIIYGSPELALEYIRDVDPMGMNSYFQFNYEQVICVLQNMGTQRPYGEVTTQLKTMYEGIDEEDKNPGLTRAYKLVQYGAARLYGKKFRAMKWKFQAK